MERVALLLACAFVVGCGRYGFNHTADGAPPGTADGSSTADAAIGDVDGSVLMLPSCDGLAATCGPNASSSCCGSPLVPGGTFLRSYDTAADGTFSGMGYPATVDSFRLDTYEVTVGRFRKFVNAGMGTQQNPPAAGSGAHAAIPGSGWQASWDQYLATDTGTLISGVQSCNPETWTDAPGANETLPINCVTWYEAFAFCIWDGGYLPTEAEWNYAAAGGNQQRAYPWSNPPSSVTIDCSYADYDTANGFCTNQPNGGMEPVGSHSPQSDGRWGQADLAGNVWEKTLDWYVGDSTGGYASSSCTNCSNLATATTRAVRGGGWNGTLDVSRVAYRYFDPPTDRYVEMGMRCARPAQ